MNPTIKSILILCTPLLISFVADSDGASTTCKGIGECSNAPSNLDGSTQYTSCKFTSDTSGSCNTRFQCSLEFGTSESGIAAQCGSKNAACVPIIDFPKTTGRCVLGKIVLCLAFGDCAQANFVAKKILYRSCYTPVPLASGVCYPNGRCKVNNSTSSSTTQCGQGASCVDFRCQLQN